MLLRTSLANRDTAMSTEQCSPMDIPSRRVECDQELNNSSNNKNPFEYYLVDILHTIMTVTFSVY